MKKRIGLLGGTFDPPHKGHISIAEEALRYLQLDEVWFIPTYEPPHKDEATTSSKHRLSMLEKMIEEKEAFHIETIEIDRKGKSYTIDTINEFLRIYDDFIFYFIIGADQVVSLHKWYRIDELIKKVKFVGVERPGIEWEERIAVQKIAAPKVDVSSTEIRDKIKRGNAVDNLIEPAVYRYIKEHQLYGYRAD